MFPWKKTRELHRAISRSIVAASVCAEDNWAGYVELDRLPDEKDKGNSLRDKHARVQVDFHGGRRAFVYLLKRAHDHVWTHWDAFKVVLYESEKFGDSTRWKVVAEYRPASGKMKRSYTAPS